MLAVPSAHFLLLLHCLVLRGVDLIEGLYPGAAGEAGQNTGGDPRPSAQNPCSPGARTSKVPSAISSQRRPLVACRRSQHPVVSRAEPAGSSSRSRKQLPENGVTKTRLRSGDTSRGQINSIYLQQLPMKLFPTPVGHRTCPQPLLFGSVRQHGPNFRAVTLIPLEDEVPSVGGP